MHILCVFIYTFEEKSPQKGAYPIQIQISNDCIYTCWVKIQYAFIRQEHNIIYNHMNENNIRLETSTKEQKEPLS